MIILLSTLTTDMNNNNKESEIVNDILYFCNESPEPTVNMTLNGRPHELPLAGLRQMAYELGIEDDLDEYRVMIASQLETIYEREC